MNNRTGQFPKLKILRPVHRERRHWLVVFGFFWLLAGCRETGSPPPALSPTALPADPTAANTAAFTQSPTVLPTATPTRSPTSGPLEAVVQTTKADVWDAPENEGQYWKLQTQLLLGEKVLVVERGGDWSRIVAVEQPSHKDPRGYPGWVRSESLAARGPAAKMYAVVMKARTHLRAERGGQPGMLLYLDSRLMVETTWEDWVQVRLPDGSTGWVPLDDVRLTEDLSLPYPTRDLFALAESLAGAPYKWGGTTSDALDCSGLPYRLFHAFGILMSRDADDQALEGTFVGRYSVRKGDLIFAATTSGGKITHEVIYWGDNRVLDADTVRGLMIRPMPDFFINYYWITARRFLP